MSAKNASSQIKITYKKLGDYFLNTPLSQLLKNGPVVINFYRGGWCQYCNVELNALQRALSDIETHSGQLVAISVENPDQAINTQESQKLDYLVLSDVDCKVAEQFGILFDVPPAYDGMLTSSKNDKFVTHLKKYRTPINF